MRPDADLDYTVAELVDGMYVYDSNITSLADNMQEHFIIQVKAVVPSR